MKFKLGESWVQKLRRDWLSIQRIESLDVDSLEVFAELNDFAVEVCCQSIIDENPEISDEELLERLREIVRMRFLIEKNRQGR